MLGQARVGLSGQGTSAEGKGLSRGWQVGGQSEAQEGTAGCRGRAAGAGAPSAPAGSGSSDRATAWGQGL